MTKFGIRQNHLGLQWDVELNWERQEPAKLLSLGAIQDLLSGSGYSIVSADLIEEGLANTNYLLEDQNGELLHMRLLQREPTGLALEVAVNGLVSDEIPVPQVLFTDPSRGVVLSTWIAGKTLQRLLSESHDLELCGIAEHAGQILATIASHKFSQAGFLTPDLDVKEPWLSVYDGLHGYVQWVANGELARSRAGAGQLDAVLDLWKLNEADLRAATAHPCLSHSDFKPSNLMVQGGRISGVLDWEFVHSGTWLTDAGQFLRYLGEHRKSTAEAFERGLRRGGLNPPANWPRLARIIDLASLCDFLNRPNLGRSQCDQILELVSKTTVVDVGQ